MVKLKVSATATQILKADPVILKGISELITYQKISKKAMRFVGVCRTGGWDGRVSLLNRFDATFPSGLLPKVIKYLKGKGHTVEIERHLPKTTEHPKMMHIEEIGSLYDFQQDAVKAMAKYKRGIIQAPTGSGKTEMAVGAICLLKRPSIFFVHTLELLDQTIERLRKYLPDDIKVGKIGDGEIDVQYVTVASIPTVSSWLIKPTQGKNETKSAYQAKLVNWHRTNAFAVDLLKKFSVAIFDECFPSNTLIDGKPISEIKIGDYVRSFNHKTGKEEYKKVYNILKSKPHEMVEVKLSDGRNIICTSKHPFYTENGYLPACLLEGLEIYEKKANNISLQSLSNSSDLSGKKWLSKFRISKEKLSLLFTGTQENMDVSEIFSYYEGDKFKKICNFIRKNVDKQSLLFKRSEGENIQNFETNRAQTFNTRGEWERSNNSPSYASKQVGLGNGVYSENESEESFSYSLQNRHSKSFIKDCNRSSRKFTLLSPKTIARSKEEKLFRKLRVESVRFLEPGDFSRPREVLPDGYVYNLEVEDNHNYYVDNILVHNCHHLAADTFFETAKHCSGAEYIFALSATPFREEEDEILIEAGAGPVIFSLTLSDVIKMGKLVPAEVHIYDYAPLPFMDIGDRYNIQYKLLIAENENRNNAICLAVKEWMNNRKILVLCKELFHIELLSRQLAEMGIRNEIVHGRLSKARRKFLKEEFGSDRLNVLIASTIYDEGVDIPAIDVVVLAGAGRSRIKTYQRLGRALRLANGKEKAYLIDFADDARPFNYHFKARMRVYKSEPELKIIQHFTAKIPSKAKARIDIKLEEGLNIFKD